MVYTITPRWKGKIITVSRRGYHELSALGMDLWDVIEILKEGFDCSVSKRKKGTIEKCAIRGKHLVRVVLKEQDFIYEDDNAETTFVLVHAGKEAFKQEKIK